MFETIEPMNRDDGRDIIRLPSKREERYGIPGLYEFHQVIEEDNVNDTFEEYELASDEEEVKMRGVEEFQRVFDETTDDFEEEEEEDYESQ